jgi:thiol-disulfide isomerase/thioredoxin
MSSFKVRRAVLAGSVAVAMLSGTTAAQPQLSEPLAKPVATKEPAANRKAKVYDEAADGKQQIAAALSRAKHENKRVLIQWGGNWCGWCLRLNELMKSDKKLAHTLLYEYELVHVDTGQPAGKNVDLAKSYGADVEKHGFPFLTILDADGKAIVNQETEALEAKGADGKSSGLAAGHDAVKVLKLLDDNKPAYLKAEDVLAAGLAKAKAEGKTAFVHFGAPWCGWCHRLEDWMAKPEIAPVLGKEFVDVKIDTDRTIGGQDVMAKYNKDAKNSGIPWFVFVDADGKAIADSTGAKGNIGFPAAPEEIEHFGSMLSKSAKKLSPAEIKGLLESLKAK